MNIGKYFKKSLIFTLLLSNISLLGAEAKNPSINTAKNTKSVKAVKENAYAESLIYFNKGKFFEEQKSISKAIEYYKLAIRKNPKLDAAYSRLGLIYAEKGDYKNSIAMFKTYLNFSKDPEERAMITEFIARMNSIIKK